MKFLNISICLFFFSLLVTPVHSQANKYGVPLITNYPYKITGGSEQNWCITQDHRGVIYVGNHDKGVLEYDGVEWRTIPVPNNVTVRSMVIGDDGVVYVGAEEEFGMLEPDQSGTLQFISLYDSTLHDQYPDIIVWKTYFEDGNTYFCCSNAIFVYNPQANDMTILDTPEYAYFPFFVDQRLYILDWDQGLMMHNGNKFVPIPGGDFFHEKFITGMEQMDGRILVSTMDDGLYLFNSDRGTVDDAFVEPALMELFITAQVPYMCILNDQILVCTFGKGLYILDKNGDVQEIISESEGLDDGTISYVYSDERLKGSGPLWIAHWKGVSKVEINSPFRSNAIGSVSYGMPEKSLGEQITDLTEYNGTLFVSTWEGIYYQSSSTEKTAYLRVPGIQQVIYDLQVFTPVPEKSFLLASSEKEIYVIDEQMEVYSISDKMINPPESQEDLEQITGWNILLDPENKDIFYTGYTHLVGIQYTRGKWKEISRVRIYEEISRMAKDKYGYMWTSNSESVTRIDIALASEATMKIFSSEHGLPQGDDNLVFLNPESQEVLVGTEDGFYQFDFFKGTFIRDTFFNAILPPGRNSIQTMHMDSEGDYWFSFNNQYSGWTELVARKHENKLEVILERPFKRLPNVSADVFLDDTENGIWFSKSGELYHYDKTYTLEKPNSFQVFIRDVRIYGDSVLFYGTNYLIDSLGNYRLHTEQIADAVPRISYRYNNITLRWSSTFFENEEQTIYSYLLKGNDSDWSRWDQSTSVRYTNLAYGNYQMQVKAKNIYGEESLPSRFSFRILRPWYASIGVIIAYVILTILLIIFVVLYTRNLRNRAEILSKKNREIEFQKAELENLNEEITAQRDEIEAQRDSITLQKDLIDEQKTAMTDSILYARRIQDAVLPAEEVMRFLLPKHFVFYRPQQIVSGDFFWVDKKDETVLLALGDCTGHGVPGAFMSMLGISLLNEISSKFPDHSTNEMVDELRDQVIAALGQTGGAGEAQDGMDMGMVAINMKSREIQFTGAQHNLYIFRKGELEVVKGDRMPVGIHTMSNKLFQAHNFKLNRGDSIYLFSDGFPDQFGGNEGKKYGYPRLKSFLTNLQDKIMHDQLTAITNEFENWKGDEMQIDDVLMIGIKL